MNASNIERSYVYWRAPINVLLTQWYFNLNILHLSPLYTYSVFHNFLTKWTIWTGTCWIYEIFIRLNSSFVRSSTLSCHHHHHPFIVCCPIQINKKNKNAIFCSLYIYLLNNFAKQLQNYEDYKYKEHFVDFFAVLVVVLRYMKKIYIYFECQW